MGKQNDLRLKITFSKIERAHSENQIPDLSIYKVNFAFQLTRFSLSISWSVTALGFFFFLIFPYSSGFGPLSVSLQASHPFQNCVATYFSSYNNNNSNNKIEAKLFFRQMRLFKRVYDRNAPSIPPSFVNMCWAQMFKFARSVFHMLIGNII